MTIAVASQPLYVTRDDWIAQAGSQRLFLSCPIIEICYEGTRGPGKTDALLMKFAKYVGRGWGAEWRGIIFRETYKQLRDIIKKAKRRFFNAFPGIKYNQSDHSFTWPTGEQLVLAYFRTPDDYNNHHGHEYPFIGWEELTNWLTSECYDIMKSCNRSSYPGMPRFYVSTCNPFGKGHNWVKSFFIDPAARGVVIRDELSPQGRVAIHGNLYENKVLLAADPDYISKLMAIPNPNRRKAWAFGDWDIVAGGMFDDVWEAETHLIEPFPIPVDWRIERAFDWGSSKPFSVGWWARASGSPARLKEGGIRHFVRGSLIRIGELYGWSGEPNVGLRWTNARIAEEIVKRETQMGIRDRCQPGPADASIFDVINGRSMYDDFADADVTFVPCDKGPGSRVSGWETMRTMLEAAMETPQEDPGMFIFNTCRQFARTVPTLPRDTINLDDVDSDAEDHIGDEARYEAQFKLSVVTQEPMFRRKH